MEWSEWALSLAVFLPGVGALIVMLIPRAEEQLIKTVALVTTLATFGVVVGILADFDYDRSGELQFELNNRWIDVINSRYHVAIDGISLPLLALSAFVTLLCVIYSWNHFPEPHNPKAFLALMLVLEVGMNGTFVAQDLILFFIFFEVVLLPMFFMIGVWGGPNREYASIKFFLFTLFGSAMMLLGFLALYFKVDVPGGNTFDMVALSEAAGAGLTRGTANLIFAGLFLGFAIKVPMFPFHTWLPDAHTEAPTVGSVLLAAILLKLGTYGFVRIALPMLPDAAEDWAPWIGLLAVIGIVYGALGCLAQSDMKRLIAFSSVAHMGFVMLGIATLTDFGINAAIFGMVAHGLITGMLFFLAGSVQHNFHTRELSRLGGLLVQAPKMGWILGFCAMASLGLPGLAGFWGEFPAILSAFSPAEGLPVETFRTYMVVAAIGTVLAAGYLLWMLQKVAFGTPKPEFEHAHVHDVNAYEWTAWLPMLVLILVLGIFPNLLFGVTDDAVTQIANVFGG
ncbi:MAG: NADH-quinone oxidoreductase subunit M [Acidimicrobiia bacterium]|nr:MAG: NADH-quinone oxidoreductase subunit M [Acidimicrobiia bacterium]